jgi:hypothetical protein
MRKCHKCCSNCIYFHGVHEYIGEDGKLTWFDSLYNTQDENGKDISINSYRCTRYSDFGDVIAKEDIDKIDVCDDFEEYNP